MEPINWLAVLLAAAIAALLGWPFGIAGSDSGPARAKSFSAVVLVMLIAAAMLGHAYARIGSATLAAKPWLYFMQSGGVAIAFVIPSLLLTRPRQEAPLERLIGAVGWLVAYLAIGAVFWALG